MRTLLALAIVTLTVPAWSVQAQTAITAREHISAAIQAAQEEDAEAQLLAISADSLSPEAGTASAWTYLFDSDEALRPIVAVQQGTATEITQARLASSASKGSFLLRGFTPSPIPQDWIEADGGWLDSDVAVQQAEQAGGSDFRTNHPDATIAARLATLPAAFAGGSEDVTAWLISYVSRTAGTFQAFTVLADGGIVFPLFGEPQSLTFKSARRNRFAARQAAEDSMAVDEVRLTSVATVVPDLNAQGESLGWSYTFYSPEQAAFRTVYTLYGRVIEVAPPPAAPPSSQALPGGWIGSDEAVAVARTDGLFQDDAGTLAQVRLTRGLYAEDSTRTAWEIDVVRARDDTSGTVYVDPQDGILLDPPTQTDREPLPDLRRVAVEGPFPHPAHRRATLRLTLPVSSAVTVEIFDVMGRRVRRLPAKKTPAGSNNIQVDATDLPAGLYLYRITVRHGNQMQEASGRLIVVK